MLRLSWLISLGISLLGFLIIGYLYNIKTEENAVSFGFIGIVLIVPFLLLSLFTTFRFFSVTARNSTNQSVKLFSLVGGLILIGVLIYMIIDFKNDTLAPLGGSASNPASKIYGLPILNQHTYLIFFNFYTYALIHTISGVFGGLIGFISTNKAVEVDKRD